MHILATAAQCRLVIQDHYLLPVVIELDFAVTCIRILSPFGIHNDRR